MTTRFAPKTRSAPAPSIAAPLLVFVRDAFRDTSLDYAEAPIEITGGFDTTIFGFRLSSSSPELAQPLIVRIFRPEVAAEQVRFESAVQAALHEGGFPAPRVLLQGDDKETPGGAFLIMERLNGTMMIDALLRPGLQRVPSIMGRLHAQLHALDPNLVQRRLDDAGVAPGWVDERTTIDGARQYIATAALDGLRPTLDWIAAKMPPTPDRLSVCHGDFHPINILMNGRGVSGVIDWSAARIGDPAWDVGATVALWTLGPVNVPGFLHRPLGVVRRWMLRRYLQAYTAERPLDMNAVEYYEAMRCFGFLIEAGMHLQAAAGVIAPIEKPTAFGDQRVQRNICKRLHEITGVEVTLPEAIST